MELDLFKEIKNLDQSKLHPKFLYLRDYIELSGSRSILESWTKGFCDRDNKIIKEFQTTFHSSLWEFYLYSVFNEAGFQIDQSKDRPDFMIKAPHNFNVEAVVANIKQDGVSEKERTMEDQLSMTLPPHLQSDFYSVMDEAITRYSTAINSKNNKYIKEYTKCEWVAKEEPFLIAISSYDQINYGREYIYPMMALLYGLYYDVNEDSYVEKTSIKKPNTSSDIPIGIFNDKKFENISAIIFSCTVTMGKLESMAISNSKFSLNQVYNIRRDNTDNRIPYKLQKVSSEHPELLSDGLFIFHNPNAVNKLEIDTFESTNATQYFIQNNMLVSTENTYPIVARFNTSKILCRAVEPMIQENLRHFNKKTLDEFYEIRK